jgi:predicted metalloprotease with PDZ domain
MRRNQDYYDEGALWWMEADAFIRNATDNKKSLDDFCADFFGNKNGNNPAVAYQRGDIMAALQRVAPNDWDGFFKERVNTPHEQMPMDFAGRLGYKLQYAPKPSAAQNEDEEMGDNLFEYDSLGLVISKGGDIRSTLVPGLPAEKAGLAPKMKVVAVNNRAFNKDRLRDALSDSVTRRNIEFLVLDGDTYRTFKIDYAGGPKYLELARDGGKPDTLEQIMKAKRTPAK